MFHWNLMICLAAFMLPNTVDTLIKLSINDVKLGQQNLSIYYQENDVKTCTCQVDNFHSPNEHSYYLNIVQKRGQHEIARIVGKRNHKAVTFQITMTKYDNDTSLFCVLLQQDQEIDRTVSVIFMWGFYSYMISPIKDVYQEGDCITCSGSSATNIRWHRIKDNLFDANYVGIGNSSKLCVDVTKHGQRYICTAYSLMANTYFRVMSVFVDIRIFGAKTEADGALVTLSGNILYQRTGIQYEEGELLKFTCYSKKEMLIMAHKKGAYKISEIRIRPNEKIVANQFVLFSDMTLYMSKFDNDTTFSCDLYNIEVENGAGNDRNILEHTFIWNGKSKRHVMYDENMVIPKPSNSTRYKVGENINCSGSKYKNWIRIKDNTIDVQYKSLYQGVRSNETLLPAYISGDDGGSNLVCYDYVQTIHHTYERHISPLTYIMVDKSEEFDVDLQGDGKSNSTLYIITAGSAFVILIIAIFTWKWCTKSAIRPLEVETYACPRSVQYVDLQKIKPKNRHVVRDDTPYAQIIGVLEPART